MIHVSKKLFSRDDLAVISVISLILMVAVEAWWLCSDGGGVHVRRGGGARRGCYIAPFTFLHQAIVLRHGPFWHNHNVIIITVAAAAFAALRRAGLRIQGWKWLDPLCSTTEKATGLARNFSINICTCSSLYFFLHVN